MPRASGLRTAPPAAPRPPAPNSTLPQHWNPQPWSLPHWRSPVVPRWDSATTLTSCPDVDGDGRREVVVGVPGPPSGHGGVYVLSSRSGELLRERASDAALDGITSALPPNSTLSTLACRARVAGRDAHRDCECRVARIDRDLDGDAVTDLVVASSDGTDASGGRLAFCSRSSGAVLRELTLSERGNFGHALAAGRDLTGDGVGDVVVGCPDLEATGMSSRVCVYSGSDALFVRHIAELDPGWYEEGFGASVALVSDLDGDKCAEIAVGCAENGDQGDGYYAVMFSGKSGKVLGRTYTNQHFVEVAAFDDDLDGDGLDEVLLGFPELDEVWIVSGSSTLRDGDDGGWQPRLVLTPRGPKPVSESNARRPPTR